MTMSDRLSQADGRRSATALDIKSVLGIFWGGGIAQAAVGLIPSQASKPPPRTVTHQSALVRWKKILYNSPNPELPISIFLEKRRHKSLSLASGVGGGPLIG